MICRIRFQQWFCFEKLPYPYKTDLAMADEDHDEDIQSRQEGTVDLPRSSATKNKRRQEFKSPPRKRTAASKQSDVAPWMQGPWMPGATSQQQQWMMGQQTPWMMGQGGPWMMGQQFPGPWMQPPRGRSDMSSEVPTTRAESEARAARRAIRKEMEERVDARRNQGQKPHSVRVKAGGGIDGGCEGKNEFDECLRSLIPRILDVSCVRWADQSPNSVSKLRSAIDNEFEYVGQHLSERGFKNAVKRQMKTERSKMKGWFLNGKKECPVSIEPDQWARLCEYWTKPETEEKAQRMANARKQVKKISNVGRAGKAGKEAQLVQLHAMFS